MALPSYQPNPNVGDLYYDERTGDGYVWMGTKWVIISAYSNPATLVPTKEQLGMYPSLNQAWEEYLVIRRILGL